MLLSKVADNVSLKDIFNSWGIDINDNAIYMLIFIVVAVLFVFGTARALYQWLAPKFGVVTPGKLGGLLLINKIKEPSGCIKQDKWSWRTFIIISLLVILTRFLVYYIGYAYKVSLAVESGYSSYGFLESFMSLWNRWDSPHYIDIARDWYLTEAQVTQGDSYLFIVFFPLFPLLMRIAGVLMPDPNNAFYFWAGCVISHVAMCIGCTYFYRLVKAECSKRVAIWSLLLLLFTPATFFFGICYTEALFLCLCITFFYYLRKGNYWVAGVLGALAAFTRSLGVLLAIPFFVEWMDCCALEGIPLRKKIMRLVPMFVVTLGTLAYLAINYFIYDDPFKFSEYQLHWGQQFSFFIDNIADIGVRALNYRGLGTTLVMWLPEFLVMVGTIVIFAISGGDKIRPSYLAYIMIYIVFAAAPSWLLSGVRYFAALFPIFILMGQFSQKHKVAGTVLMVASVGLMAAYAIGFVSGMQIM
ncbi:MAG: hypothetical protein IKK58_05180 [Clostridia bacterium]|nr:hypothetical protein [Clostridia bacterium]